MPQQNKRNTRFKLRDDLVDLVEVLRQMGGFETLGSAVNYIVAVYTPVVLELIKQQQQGLSLLPDKLPSSPSKLPETPLASADPFPHPADTIVETPPPEPPRLGGFGDSIKRIRQRLA